MKHFLPSYFITALALSLAYMWACANGLFVCVLLIVLEISFSFDNAVVNATVMRTMPERWRQRFLTWGMAVSVFGMYFLFPLLIVALASGLSLIEVLRMAIHAPAAYSEHVSAAHAQIDAFGGMFLLMVFLTFILDDCKEQHWLGPIEKQLARLGKLESVEIIVSLSLLLVLQGFLPAADRLPAVLAGIAGVTLYVVVSSVVGLFRLQEASPGAPTGSGLAGFIYLSLLDASFSLDAVVGSFAISNDIVIILLGLSAGAMFVRSLTVQLVRQDTLSRYVFLEHGAYYAIGALALIMLVSIITPVPQVVTGVIGVLLILAAFGSSVRYNRKR